MAVGPVGPASDEELAGFRRLIDDWAEEERVSNPLVAAVDRDPDRWAVPVVHPPVGGGKDRTSRCG